MKDSLKPQESSGSTIAFTSMARWKVSRHAPILPPHNSLIVAHTAPLSSEAAFLGATYDHRALSGGDVVRTLQKVGTPPED
jgi:pyruvate dehydrogenase E2 component (dihydrolipoamide acetyltransferase)